MTDERRDDDFRSMPRPPGPPPSHNVPAQPAGAQSDAEQAPDAGEREAAGSDPPAAPTRPEKQLPNLDDGPRLGRLLGIKGDESAIYGPISDRLRGLSDDPVNFDEQGDAEAAPRRVLPQLTAELTFTAGPRAGETLTIDQGSIALDRDAQPLPDGSYAGMAVSIWSQGSRFMLRHSGSIVISGSRPSLPVVTLDDGDELAWGAHRMRFHIEAAPTIGG